MSSSNESNPAPGPGAPRARDVSRFTEEGVRDYEKRRYRGIDQRLVHARETRLIERYFAAIRAASGSGQGEAILDLPCGYGRFSGLLRPRAGRLVNSDLSFEMVKRATRAAPGARNAGGTSSRELRGAQAQEGRAGRDEPGTLGAVANAKQGLPFKDGAFDVVFSLRFFHHVHEPGDREAILREFRRVSSGWAIVSFYRMSGLHAVQRRLRRLFGKSRTRIKMIEPGTFEREAAAAGFEVVAVEPLFRGLHAYHLALLKK
jgi:SAM-dependent methyltransferase